jgi:hypothetical protein
MCLGAATALPGLSCGADKVTWPPIQGVTPWHVVAEAQAMTAATALHW